MYSRVLGREHKSRQALRVRIGFGAATRRVFPLSLPNVVCKHLLSPKSTIPELQGQPERLWEPAELSSPASSSCLRAE